MARVKDWIATCDQEHETCAFLSAERGQPTRILDISKDNPIVLHTTAAKGRYVALSYCWGTSEKNVLLTSSTFNEFTSKGIDRNTLPKTIRDAIAVCRELGVSNLWVDALCIIQRQLDLKDFMAEAPRMCDYYRNAYFTLIAGSPQDCADGFLIKRDNPKAEPCELTYDRKGLPSDEDMTGSVMLFMLPSQHPGPIQGRAWTFQESALSQRTLVYGLDQIRFVCPTHSIYEDGEFQKIYNPNERLSFNPAGYPNIHHLVRHGNKAEIVGRAYETWFGILHSYTSRSLSDTQDKLAAIAGYANLLQRIIECDYIYGIWIDTLPEGLLWKTSRPRLAHKTGYIARNESRAPSWSWTSIDGPVIHTPTHRRRHINSEDTKSYYLKVLSCEHVPRSFDPIRSVADTSIAFQMEVCGLMREVLHAGVISKRPSEFMLSSSRTESSANSLSFRLRNEPTQDYAASGTWDTYEAFEKRTYHNQQIYALLVLPKVGLLLSHASGMCYQRVGHFWQAKEELFEDTTSKRVVLI